MMDKKQLESLRMLYIEVDELAGDIISLKPKVVIDSVTGCTPERTDKHVIPIKGIDMDKTAIKRIENGERYVTDIELKAFSEIFSVSTEFLLEQPVDSV